MVMRLVNSIYTSVQRNVRAGAFWVQTRSYSEKNELLKEELRYYVDQVEKHVFDFGAVKAYSTKTDELEVYSQSESFRSNNAGWRFKWFRDSSASGDRRVVTSFWIFEKGYDAIRNYISGEDLHPSYVSAFEALERFYTNKEFHERYLRRGFDRTSTDTGISAVIAQHLLSQLIPCPSNYFLDNTSEEKLDGCPCGCGKLIHYGFTYIGNPTLFYGNADIVLFPGEKNLFENFENNDDNSSAVFTFKLFEKEKEIYDRNLEFNGHWDSEIENENDIVMDEIERYDTPFRQANTFRQLCKQAISLSLCKQNRMHNNPQYYKSQSAMFPLCAMTKDLYEIVLYDAENDCLLRSLSPMYLFDEDMLSLSTSAVIDLWFVINHSLFCTKQTDETTSELRGTCNLCPQVGEDFLESVVANSTWMFKPDYTNQISSDLPTGGAQRADERSRIWEKIRNYKDLKTDEGET